MPEAFQRLIRDPTDALGTAVLTGIDVASGEAKFGRDTPMVAGWACAMPCFKPGLTVASVSIASHWIMQPAAQSGQEAA